MKSFLKNILSTCLGTLLAIFSIIAVSIIVITIYFNKKTNIHSGILHIPIEGLVKDNNSASINLEQLDFSSGNISMWEIRNKLASAKNDNNIKGIFLDLKNADISQNLALEIMEYLLDFKTSGKKIYSYSYYFNQNSYLLSSISDSIYLNPNGGVDLKGYAMYAPFFNKLLDKLGVDINVYYAGKFKGSTEPYRLDQFSEENKYQSKTYLDQLYEILISNISKNRNIEVELLNKIVKEHITFDAGYMLEHKIIDQLAFYDEFENELNRIFDGSELVAFKDYEIKPSKTEKSRIALVFAEGEIVWGNSGNGVISHEKYAKIFQEIRKDDRVKGVVIRFNSPGGNGYASDLLNREISLTRASGKKVYASFGNMAASGAYYIASACDTIIAMENSLTGSIGVYIMLPTFNKFLEKNFDVNVDSIASSPSAIGYNALFEMSEQQHESFKKETEKLYELFIKRVSDGRSMDKDSVQAIAQGRIWSGKDGLRKGLVDKLGTLEETIGLIAKSQNLTDYSIDIYPKQSNNPFSDLLMESIGESSIDFLSKIKALSTETSDIQNFIKAPSPKMDFPLNIFVTNK